MSQAVKDFLFPNKFEIVLDQHSMQKFVKFLQILSPQRIDDYTFQIDYSGSGKFRLQFDNFVFPSTRAQTARLIRDYYIPLLTKQPWCQFLKNDRLNEQTYIIAFYWWICYEGEKKIKTLQANPEKLLKEFEIMLMKGCGEFCCPVEVRPSYCGNKQRLQTLLLKCLETENVNERKFQKFTKLSAEIQQMIVSKACYSERTQSSYERYALISLRRLSKRIRSFMDAELQSTRMQKTAKMFCFKIMPDCSIKLQQNSLSARDRYVVEPWMEVDMEIIELYSKFYHDDEKLSKNFFRLMTFTDLLRNGQEELSELQDKQLTVVKSIAETLKIKGELKIWATKLNGQMEAVNERVYLS